WLTPPRHGPVCQPSDPHHSLGCQAVLANFSCPALRRFESGTGVGNTIGCLNEWNEML
ncbi:hypothetical protein A2U01_0109426, partial [Trifolium medium]|nr:hypothetical protein [Trifolium medium]